MKILNNILTKIVFTITSALWMCACADLDLPNDGRISIQELFNSQTRIRSFYNTCVPIPSVGFNYWNSPLASFCDEAHDASDMTTGGVYDWYNNRMSPTNMPIGSVWGMYYTLIGKCNTFIKTMNDPELPYQFSNPIEKAGYIAEVRVARAYYYLQLIKRYGGIPIIDTPYEMDHDFSNDRRATFEEVADFIISECDVALATEESEGLPVGFRWAITDAERGKITRAFAYAVKSQTVLFAASPLWNTSGSKYTWEKAATITKEALDQCLAHDFQLYDTPVDPSVAQNPYAYYFITPSDGSRSWDKETIFQSSDRSSVWQYAGLPITAGMSKAGSGPSQELVDSYEMQATGEPPILGYSDASRLQVMPNPASGYEQDNPYSGRDPRFYASIYYNEAAKNLNTTQILPFDIEENPGVGAPWNSEVTVTNRGAYWEINTFTTGGNYPWVTFHLSGNCSGDVKSTLTFEYQTQDQLGVTGGGVLLVFANPAGDFISTPTIPPATFSETGIDPNDESLWKTFSYDLSQPISAGFGDNTNMRFDFRQYPTTVLIRNSRIIKELEPTRVETFVGGNCGISNQATETRFTRTGYYMRKFNDYRSNNTLNADGYMRIFRLAELYLNFAEAACQSAGPDAPVASTVGGDALSARDAVNAVRKRADMPGFPLGMTKEAFEKKYRNERRVELAFEEHRFFDVRRWKILSQTDGFVTGMRITNSSPLKYERIKLADRGTNADKYLILPLDVSEVTKMEILTGENWQNPGWY
jgi:hypothetical protein